MTDQEKAEKLSKEYVIIPHPITPNEIMEIRKTYALKMADWKNEQFYKQCVDEGFLYEWYIKSVFPKDATPVWTEEHIEELLRDFYVIPKTTEEKK